VHDALAILSRYPCRCGSRCRRGAPSRSRPSRHQRLGVVAPCALAESPLASGALHLLVPWVATVCQTGSALLAQPVACGDPLSSPRLKPGASSGDEGERHAAQAVFARSHALRGGCGDTRRVRHRPPGPGHPLPHRGRAQPPAAGEAPRRVPHARCGGRARLVQILLPLFAQPVPTSGSSWRPAVKGTEQWIEAGGLASPPSACGR
jgi:hypothetical protein